jgi:hypothetical protein
VDDVTFRPVRGYRTRLLLHALAPLFYSASCFTLYLWRGRFRTLLTVRGIEIHGYVNRLIPWECLKAVEEVTFDANPDAQIQVANPWTRAPSARSARSPNRKVAAVRIHRTSGRRIELPVPAVTDSASDPDFEDKVREIRARWQKATLGIG